MKKLKWMLVCIPVAICMLFAVVFSACTVGEVDTHHWDDGEVTKEATCGEDGEKTYHCTDEGCDATKTEVIPATGNHTWNAGVEQDDGSILYTCTVCGATTTEEPSEDEENESDDTNQSNNGNEDDDDGETDTITDPVTITLDLPSAVSLKSSYSLYSSYNEETGALTVERSSSITLPTDSDFDKDEDNAFGTRTLQGWYIKGSYTSSSATACDMITTTTYSASADVTLTPYWSYPSGFEMMYFNSASGNKGNLQVENVAGMTTDVHAKYTVSSITAYTTVIDPLVPTSDSSFDYAVPGTVLQNTSGVTSGDQFRCATSVPNSDNVIANDNIEFYEFQNQGTVACYFKAYLTNSTMDKGTSYMYIYLNPGETVIFFVSLEFSSGSTPNNSLIVFTADAAATSLKLAVANGFLPGSSATVHGGSFTYTDLLSQGFNIYSGSSSLEEGNYSSSSYSETSFVAYLTDSTAGVLNSGSDVYEISGQAPTTTSLNFASIDLADTSVKKN